MNTASEAAPTPTQSTPEAGRSRWRTIGELVFFACCIVALIFAIDICVLLLSGSGSERRDFISYWAAGQQLVHHHDPYDGQSTLALERSLGFPTPSQALIVRNPPYALLLVAPLGFMSFRVAALIWSVLLLGGWIVSVRVLWAMQPRSAERLNILGYSISPGLVGCLFAPALAGVFFGQTALFALFGFVLFLRLHRSRPFLAGASLWLCALKPHLFLPFAAALGVWIVLSRSYAVVAGAALSVGTSSIVIALLDPQAWAQYAAMMRTAGFEREFIPCLSIALRFVLSPNSAWVQYVPAAMGCIWAVVYYWRRRQVWNWIEQGPMLVMVSMVVSPYAWLTDQVLALPGLMQAVFRVSFRNLLLLALASSAIELAILSNVYMHSPFYLWTAPVWLAWYICAILRGGPIEGLQSMGRSPEPVLNTK